MIVTGINRILKWCGVLSNGRNYTCPTKEINGELFFHFKKEWHRVSDYISKYADELIEENGRTIYRSYRP